MPDRKAVKRPRSKRRTFDDRQTVPLVIPTQRSLRRTHAPPLGRAALHTLMIIMLADVTWAMDVRPTNRVDGLNPFIVVVGESGSGKSSFLGNLAGDKELFPQSASGEACTTKPQLEIIKEFGKQNGRQIELMDTCGFNDSAGRDAKFRENLIAQLETELENRVTKSPAVFDDKPGFGGIDLVVIVVDGNPNSNIRLDLQRSEQYQVIAGMFGEGWEDNAAFVVTHWTDHCEKQHDREIWMKEIKAQTKEWGTVKTPEELMKARLHYIVRQSLEHKGLPQIKHDIPLFFVDNKYNSPRLIENETTEQFAERVVKQENIILDVVDLAFKAKTSITTDKLRTVLTQRETAIAKQKELHRAKLELEEQLRQEKERLEQATAREEKERRLKDAATQRKLSSMIENFMTVQEAGLRKWYHLLLKTWDLEDGKLQREERKERMSAVRKWREERRRCFMYSESEVQRIDKDLEEKLQAGENLFTRWREPDRELLPWTWTDEFINLRDSTIDDVPTVVNLFEEELRKAEIDRWQLEDYDSCWDLLCTFYRFIWRCAQDSTIDDVPTVVNHSKTGYPKTDNVPTVVNLFEEELKKAEMEERRQLEHLDHDYDSFWPLLRTFQRFLWRTSNEFEQHTGRLPYEFIHDSLLSGVDPYHDRHPIDLTPRRQEKMVAYVLKKIVKRVHMEEFEKGKRLAEFRLMKVRTEQDETRREIKIFKCQHASEKMRQDAEKIRQELRRKEQEAARELRLRDLKMKEAELERSKRRVSYVGTGLHGFF